MKTRSVALFATIFYAASASADVDPCGSLSLGPDERNCQSEKAQTEDAKLKATYERVVAENQKKDPSFVKALEKSQLAWLSYRDAYCQAYVQSIQIIPNSPWKDWWLDKCLTRVTSARAAELAEDFLSEPSK